MMRNDGDYVIYQIESYYPNDNKQVEGSWFSLGGEFAASLPKNTTRTRSGESKAGPWRAFAASGKCWQQTGAHGTFHVSVARDLMIRLATYNLGVAYRIKRTYVRQVSSICGEMKIEE